MSSELDLQPAVSPELVLVLATDASLIEAVRSAFTSAQFEVHHATDLTVAATFVHQGYRSLAIVDCDVDNAALLDWATAHGSMAVIALTRATDPQVSVAALERGADDVLVVPFLPAEMLARARALIRRSRRAARPLPPLLRTGQLEIDLVRRKTLLDGVDVGLTPVEQSLLYVLAASAGQILSRDAILNGLWGPEYASDSNIVDRHIRNLRSKLGDDWRHPRFIATVPGEGYRFVFGIRCPKMIGTYRQQSRHDVGHDLQALPLAPADGSPPSPAITACRATVS